MIEILDIEENNYVLKETLDIAKEIAEKALDEYVYEGKTIRQWAEEIIANNARWIPCSERLPEVNKEVILCQKDGYMSSGHLTSNGDFLDDSYMNFKNITAWMPFPEPYKPEKEPSWKDRVLNTFLGGRM